MDLSAIEAFAPPILAKLTSLRIATAEQFVALANIADRRGELLRFLGIDRAELDGLVTAARAVLPEDVLRELDRPVDTSSLGLGARKPPDADPQ